MKVTIFHLENPSFEQTGEPIFGESNSTYRVPILPAYAIIGSRLEMENSINLEAGFVPPRYVLLDDSVITPSRPDIIMAPNRGMLTIYHNGIKNYQLLFPHVNEDSLKARLGQFAEEAEKAFESQSWISYCLMVGAVLEGLLFNEFGNKHFKKLVELANQSNLVNALEADLINKIRETRNLIHACKHNEPIAGRGLALDLSVAYDRLLKRVWNP